jgi:DNA-binding MarR family transcriptional regulator
MAKQITDSEAILMLENQLCFPVYALSRLLTQAYQPYLLTHGLTYPQYLVLLLLWEHAALTVKEIGEKLFLDSGTLTPLLKRMEKKSWISRSRDPKDERSVIIAITEQGEALKKQAKEIPAQLLHKLNMETEEMYQLRNQLNQLITILK